MAKKFALDIFDLLRRIDDPRAGDIYPTLSSDEQKGVAPLVLMRWLSGTSDEQQLMLLNTFANPSIFLLGKHPHLLLRLLQACSSKTPKRYQWLGIKSAKKSALSQDVVAEYYEMSLREVRLLNPFPATDEILKMAEELGFQKDDLAKLQKELKS